MPNAQCPMPYALCPMKLFYSCCPSPRDEELVRQLDDRLNVLQQEGAIASWHRRIIGEKNLWENQIDIHLDTADIILLLIGEKFLESGYVEGAEVFRALERHKAGQARLIPVLLSVEWERAPGVWLQPLPSDRKPITQWQNRDRAFESITAGIRAAAVELTASREAVERETAIEFIKWLMLAGVSILMFIAGANSVSHYANPARSNPEEPNPELVEIPEPYPEATEIPNLSPETTDIPAPPPEATPVPEPSSEATEIPNLSPKQTEITAPASEPTEIPNLSPESIGIPLSPEPMEVAEPSPEPRPTNAPTNAPSPERTPTTAPTTAPSPEPRAIVSPSPAARENSSLSSEKIALDFSVEEPEPEARSQASETQRSQRSPQTATEPPPDLEIDEEFFETLLDEVVAAGAAKSPSSFGDSSRENFRDSNEAAELQQELRKKLRKKLRRRLAAIAPGTRQKLGSYRGWDKRLYLGRRQRELQALPLSRLALNRLTDARFFYQFPEAPETLDCDRYPQLCQVWLAANEELLAAVTAGDRRFFENILSRETGRSETGRSNSDSFSFTGQGTLEPGAGKVFLAYLYPGGLLQLRLDSQPEGEILLSIHDPSIDYAESKSQPLLDRSPSKAWSGEIVEQGYYEILLVSQAGVTLDYEIIFSCGDR